MADKEKSSLLSFSNIRVIFRREFRSYFNSAIAYVFLGIFIIIVNFFLFYFFQFWDRGRSPGGFFDLLRLAYIFLVPAITMRLWAEERKSGTIEMLLTLPYSTLDLVIGKYLSALAFLGVALLSTIMFPVTIIASSTPDWFMIIGGYLGAVLLGSAYIALGLFISWLTKDQIVAFLISLALFLVLWLMGFPQVLQFVGPLEPVFAFLSISWHYDSLIRGMLDSRDIIHFVTATLLFLYLNKRSIEKWQGAQGQA